MAARSAANDVPLEAKIVVLGSAGVGKTCLVVRYVEGKFSNNIANTIGAAFLIKKLTVDGQKMVLQIWDTAGQERFRSMAPMYYRNAIGSILVYDVTSMESFERVKDWVSELQENADEDIVIVIAANKVDLEEKRVVRNEVAKEFAESVGAALIETSALSDIGVGELFTSLGKSLVEKYKTQPPPGSRGGRKLTVGDPSMHNKKKCC
mmetsp:Transcript_8869/g.24076  ORF Transcript_8869/g.24076 Transcript_8869/m.24076 type:complete len:207 (-) Transcript_8869:1742-2362(-)